MRDGIYKNLPMRRGYHSLVRSCMREVERGDTANRFAEKAVEQDVRAEVSPTFVAGIIGRADSQADLPGLSPLARCSDPRELGGSSTPLEKLCLSHARRLEREGKKGKSLAQNALVDALRSWVKRQERQIEQHCLAEGGTSARPVVQAAHNALRSVDLGGIADRLVSGEKPASSAPRKPVQLDEDLTKRP